MSELHRLATRVVAHLESAYEQDPIGLVRAKGRLASDMGFLVSLIGPNHPDDPEKLLALRRAAVELGVEY